MGWQQREKVREIERKRCEWATASLTYAAPCSMDQSGKSNTISFFFCPSSSRASVTNFTVQDCSWVTEQIWGAWLMMSPVWGSPHTTSLYAKTRWADANHERQRANQTFSDATVLSEASLWLCEPSSSECCSGKHTPSVCLISCLLAKKLLWIGNEYIQYAKKVCK